MTQPNNDVLRNLIKQAAPYLPKPTMTTDTYLEWLATDEFRAEVTAFSDNRGIEIIAADDFYTPDQAREVAFMILAAADQAEQGVLDGPI